MDDAILAELQQRHAERTRSEGKPGSSKSDEYPGVHDVECVCVTPMCGTHFSVPMWFVAPDRPFAPAPKVCDDCRAKMDAAEAERIRLEQSDLDRREREAKRVDVLSLVERAGGNPFQFGTYTLDDFPVTPGQKKALGAITEWTAAVLSTRGKYEKVRGVYLSGPTGTAKTQLLHCSMRRLLGAGMEPGVDVIFDDSLSLIERVQGTYGSDESTWALLEARINARVWLLDDFMAEKATDDVVRKLTLIFNRREGKPTAVTSNYKPNELASKHAEYFRLMSRFGTANFRLVSVTGDDMRFRPEAA